MVHFASTATACVISSARLPLGPSTHFIGPICSRTAKKGVSPAHFSLSVELPTLCTDACLSRSPVR